MYCVDTSRYPPLTCRGSSCGSQRTPRGCPACRPPGPRPPPPPTPRDPRCWSWGGWQQWWGHSSEAAVWRLVSARPPLANWVSRQSSASAPASVPASTDPEHRPPSDHRGLSREHSEWATHGGLNCGEHAAAVIHVWFTYVWLVCWVGHSTGPAWSSRNACNWHWWPAQPYWCSLIC